MPDLSNLLGAVYGDGPSSKDRDPEDEPHVEREAAADERTPAVPDWADDEHLDAAFAQWKPGPAEDAAPAEHAFVVPATDDPPPPLADDLAAALSEALVASSGTADDTDDYGFKPTKVVDFSEPDDEPVHQVVEPVHQVVEANQAERATFGPPVENAPEPTNLSKSETERDERSETEQVHELGEVVAEDVPREYEDEARSEDEDEDEDHLRHQPAITPQRAAAAELTAANRAEPQPDRVVTPTPPEPESTTPATAPVPTVPLPVTPAPTPVAAPATASVTTLPVGARRWDRADDDILPDKQTKKFFSFSLRRG
jgi:hypothetical protein